MSFEQSICQALEDAKDDSSPTKSCLTALYRAWDRIQIVLYRTFQTLHKGRHQDNFLFPFNTSCLNILGLLWTMCQLSHDRRVAVIRVFRSVDFVYRNLIFCCKSEFWWKIIYIVFRIFKVQDHIHATIIFIVTEIIWGTNIP